MSIGNLLDLALNDWQKIVPMGFVQQAEHFGDVLLVVTWFLKWELVDPCVICQAVHGGRFGFVASKN